MQDRDKEVSGKELNQHRDAPAIDPMRLVREVVEQLQAEQRNKEAQATQATEHRASPIETSSQTTGLAMVGKASDS
jgi:hypothetical protein